MIVTPPDNPAGIESLDDLDGATWVRCADEVPCGRVASAVLEDNGVTAEPASLEEDVRATLDKVISGEADAGLVYATDAVAAGDDVTAIEIPGAESQLTSYFIDHAGAVARTPTSPRSGSTWSPSEDGQAGARRRPGSRIAVSRAAARTRSAGHRSC